MINVVSKRDHHVQTVVAAGHLKNDKNRPILSGDRLRERLSRERIEGEKCFLEKDRAASNWLRLRELKCEGIGGACEEWACVS